MALNQDNCIKAFHILKDIFGDYSNLWIEEYDENNPLQMDAIIGLDRKADGGWENVFVNVRDITQEQLALFHKRKSEVVNSYFIAKQSNSDVTRIGFF